MQDYGKIQELFGAPLNTVPKPQTPFKLNGWHLLGIGVGLFVLYKGFQKIKEDYFPNGYPKIKRKDD